MGVQTKWSGAWQPTVPGRLMYIRIGGVWRPILDMWIRGTPTPGGSALPANTFIDPFDTLTNWTTGSPSLIAGRTGQGIRADGNSQGQGTLHTLLAAQQSDTVTVGFAFRANTYTGDSHVLSLCGDAGATTHVVVTLGTARDVYAWRGTTTPLGNTTSHAAFPAANTWFYVEVQAKLHDTTGFVIVHINGIEVLNLQNQDTKNAGTGTVFDSLRISSGNQFNQPAAIDDLYVTPGATFLGDINASSPPTTPPSSADHVWHKESSYTAPQLVPPTNLRMNPASPNVYDSFQIAWDWSQPANGLPVGDFQVVLTNNAGTWFPAYDPNQGGGVFVGAGVRSYNFTGLSQNTQYAAYVKARYPGGGRPDTVWAGPLKWQTGAAAYQVQDVPVAGWGAEDLFLMQGGHVEITSSVAVGDANTWGVQRALDNDFSTRWNTDVVNETSGYQGEGFRCMLPYWGNYRINGLRLWNWSTHTAWLCVFLNGGWQRANSVPYVGKYQFLREHGYETGVGSFSYGDVRVGPYDIYNHNEAAFDLLMQQPQSDGYALRIGILEFRVLFQPWTIIRYDYRTVAAVPSAAW